jgi:hypothetical protein
MTNTAYGIPLFGGSEWNLIWMWTTLGALLALAILGAGHKLRQLFIDHRARRAAVDRHREALRELASTDFSMTQAMSLAETILERDPTRPDDDIWANQALIPLAAMLYAASGQGNGGGMGWVARTAAGFDDNTWGAGLAAAIPERCQRLLSPKLVGIDGYDPRQRAGLAMAIRSAVGAQMCAAGMQTGAAAR